MFFDCFIFDVDKVVFVIGYFVLELSVLQLEFFFFVRQYFGLRYIEGNLVVDM